MKVMQSKSFSALCSRAPSHRIFGPVARSGTPFCFDNAKMADAKAKLANIRYVSDLESTPDIVGVDWKELALSLQKYRRKTIGFGEYDKKTRTYRDCIHIRELSLAAAGISRCVRVVFYVPTC